MTTPQTKMGEVVEFLVLEDIVSPEGVVLVRKNEITQGTVSHVQGGDFFQRGLLFIRLHSIVRSGYRVEFFGHVNERGNVAAPKRSSHGNLEFHRHLVNEYRQTLERESVNQRVVRILGDANVRKLLPESFQQDSVSGLVERISSALSDGEMRSYLRAFEETVLSREALSNSERAERLALMLAAINPGRFKEEDRIAISKMLEDMKTLRSRDYNSSHLSATAALLGLNSLSQAFANGDAQRSYALFKSVTDQLQKNGRVNTAVGLSLILTAIHLLLDFLPSAKQFKGENTFVYSGFDFRTRVTVTRI